MDNFLQKMHFRGHSVDVSVEDIDRCLLIDVINDMYDEAEKHEMPLPTHPTLAYNFDMKSVTLNNDRDLMEMFSRYLGKKSIDIWIGCDSYPSDVLRMAGNLRGNNSSKDDQSIVVFDPFDNITLEPMPSPPNVQITDPSFRNCNREKLQVRKPRLIDVTTHASLSPKRSIRRSQTQVTEHNFKIPKATAKLKGIYVPKNRMVEIADEENSRRVTRATRGLLRVDYDDDSDGSESDRSYEPSDNCDLIVDEEDMTDLEMEDNLLVSSL
ncbi:hypothetical protein RND81_11G074300 [Saponaria officinalis]|uniref:Uncharacterized protein n=1 Tax=Saponaria officinalis TaxID=3572 RepID=A0AAW1HJH1_SAPOF